MKDKIQKKEVTQKNNNTLKTNKEKQEPSSNKRINKTWLWIGIGCVLIVIIAVLLWLRAQNLYRGKIFQKNLPKTETKSQTISPTSKLSIKENLLYQAFRYPNSTEVPAEDEMYCLKLILYTNDSAVIVNQYYLELIDLNNWETGPIGMQTGNKAAFLYIYQDDFGADINIKEEETNKGSTKIEVNITCQNDQAITSTFNIPSQPTNPPDNLSPQTTDGNSYILPFSNSRAVIKKDLLGLTHWELKVARNEIYARHGRTFVHQDLACYFKDKSWYNIDPEYTEKKLSSLETSNAVFILNYEKEINSPLTNKDTGCK